MAYRVGITGSRRRTDRYSVNTLVMELFEKYKDDLIIVSGGCWGVDTWAEEMAKSLGVRTEIYKPQFDGSERSQYEFVNRYYERNHKIAMVSNEIHAFVSEDRTGGTENTIKHALKMNKTVYIYEDPTKRGGTV